MTSTDDSTRHGGSASRPYLSFLALTAGILVTLMAVGQLPTRHWAGEGAVLAMIAGCAISFVAALVGTVPVVLARGQEAPATVPAVMLSITLRLGVVIALGLAAVWSGLFEVAPLLVWMVLSHAVLQVADVRLAQQVLYPS